MGCCTSIPADSPKNHTAEEKQGMLVEGTGTTSNNIQNTTNGAHGPHTTNGSNGGVISMHNTKKRNKKSNNKNKNIGKNASSSSMNDNRVRYKILLLGPGMSGKTTIIKQMRKLHGQQYTQKDFMNCKPHLTSNLIESFRKLCIYSDILAEQPSMSQQNSNTSAGTNGSGSNEEKTNRPLQKNETLVLEENKELRDEIARLNDRTTFTEALYIKFSKILSDPGIQKTLEYRYQFQLNDNFDYLTENMDKYCQNDYIPTFQDYLNVKQRTVGIQKLNFTLAAKQNNNVTEHYEIHDAGGQRNERKKWMHVILGAKAFIFVAALSGYNQSLWEEPSYNRMKEAIHLFRRIFHMEALQKAHVILFLNKTDLFDKKVTKYSIKEQFPNYHGKETKEQVKLWIVQQFKDQMDLKYAANNNPSSSNNKYNNNDNNGGEIAHTNSSSFSPTDNTNDNNHSNPSPRALYHHFTCATDTQSVNKVFELTRDILVFQNLGSIGFI